MYLKIITGEQSIDYFDEFVKTWKSTGGDDITKEVKTILTNPDRSDKVNKIFIK